MTDKEQEALRREFERPYREKYDIDANFLLKRDIDGLYIAQKFHNGWLGFQAGAAYGRKAAMEEVNHIQEKYNELRSLMLHSAGMHPDSKGNLCEISKKIEMSPSYLINHQALLIESFMRIIEKLKGGL